ncbi:MAG: Asp-tRNA(Asn)/Glu-tRNA(Gln) amidotransferase subunit GatC [Chloroflexi bacterium]|nr:Asp-tRNA(Asn)/Glu-tRNA(Gln) amidotransferase subunit GatC [Chloroflexota bacterium]
MRLTREEVQHIAKLARIGFSESDVAMFQEELSEILGHFEALRALDTKGVPPTSHAVPLENVMRADEVSPSLSQEDVLANAPRSEDGAFRVQAVLEE